MPAGSRHCTKKHRNLSELTLQLRTCIVSWAKDSGRKAAWRQQPLHHFRKHKRWCFRNSRYCRANYQLIYLEISLGRNVSTNNITQIITELGMLRMFTRLCCLFAPNFRERLFCRARSVCQLSSEGYMLSFLPEFSWGSDPSSECHCFSKHLSPMPHWARLQTSILCCLVQVDRIFFLNHEVIKHLISIVLQHYFYSSIHF